MSNPDESLYGDEHVRAYQETDGERGYFWRRGSEILLLTTTGRKSGRPRTHPLIHRPDNGGWVIVASDGGAPEHPSWMKNLLADPEATIQVRADEIPVRARVTEGEERERLWRLMNEAWPPYDSYQERTERQIPVVVLERRAASS